MPSTRLRSRSQLSQSSQPATPAVRESQLETQTLDTLSTAVLPTSYTVHLASNHAISDEERANRHQIGQEFLSDGVRRINDKEGDLGDLRSRKRRRVQIDQPPKSEKVDKEVYWYSANLQYPCSCNLAPLSRAFTIRQPPPSVRDLPDLSDIANSAERVRLAEEIPEWDIGQAGYVDLEPELSDLEAFEHGWKDALGSIWRQSQHTGRFCDAFDNHDHDHDHDLDPELGPEPVQTENQSYEMVVASLLTRRMRKGKFKAVDIRTPSLVPVPVSIPAIITQSTSLQTEDNDECEAREAQAGADWQAEGKRRKQLWRGLIGKDPGFGQFWETLSRPHSYSDIGSLPDLPRPPDYNLFRNYQIATHPFHPDLHRYARKNPQGRIHWLIPIHGPVILPTLNDEMHQPGAVAEEKGIPIPSSATFASNHPTIIPGKSSRPAPIRWTPELLDHFVKSFLLPLRQSRLFSLSLTFSGPKPDPFLNLPSPAPLSTHLYVSKSKSKKTNDNDRITPVRPEAGDHLRVYCDVKEALSLRTWLNGVAIDPTIIGQTGGAGVGIDIKPWRLFDKVRLCLVGERGEILMIA